MSEPLYDYNEESEKAILSRILNKGFGSLPDDAPGPGAFSEANALIYRTAQELHERREEVNPLSVSNVLEERGELKRVGGRAGITDIAAESYFDGVVATACLSVHECFKQREVRRMLADGLAALNSGDTQGALELVQKQMPQFLADVPPGGAMLAASLLTDEALAALEISQRPTLMGDWFKAGDYGVIFGRRGLGKSWLALGLARAISEGRNFGPWQCRTPRRVLYVDGEMALDDYRTRLQALSGAAIDTGGQNAGEGNFLTLSHQKFFDKTGKSLCLSDPDQQRQITRLCEQGKVDVLFLDNGACLFRGVAENDADDFRDKIEGWLLDLRRRGIASVLVLHAGRNGAIRGTSKREDAAFWILRLDEANNGHETHGTRFLTRFVKNRNAAQDPPPLDWHFQPMNGKTLVTYKDADSIAIFRQWIADGLTSASDIASEMGLTKGTVSKMAERGKKEGWLRKEGREYALVEP